MPKSKNRRKNGKKATKWKAPKPPSDLRNVSIEVSPFVTKVGEAKDLPEVVKLGIQRADFKVKAISFAVITLKCGGSIPAILFSRSEPPRSFIQFLGKGSADKALALTLNAYTDELINEWVSRLATATSLEPQGDGRYKMIGGRLR